MLMQRIFHSFKDVRESKTTEKNSVQPFVYGVVQLALKVAAENSSDGVRQELQQLRVVGTCFGGYDARQTRIPDAVVVELVAGHEQLNACLIRRRLVLSVEAKSINSELKDVRPKLLVFVLNRRTLPQQAYHQLCRDGAIATTLTCQKVRPLIAIATNGKLWQLGFSQLSGSMMQFSKLADLQYDGTDASFGQVVAGIAQLLAVVVKGEYNYAPLNGLDST